VGFETAGLADQEQAFRASTAFCQDRSSELGFEPDQGSMIREDFVLGGGAFAGAILGEEAHAAGVEEAQVTRGLAVTIQGGAAGAEGEGEGAKRVEVGERRGEQGVLGGHAGASVEQENKEP
jgi:hypothetical protein